MTEEWRKVVGFPDYSVSNMGCIRRDVDAPGGRWKAGHILKPKTKWNGYHYVALHKDKREKYLNVHAVVAEAFIGPRPAKNDVCHINNIRQDNRAENLRYGTRSENEKDKVVHGTDNRGSRHYSAHLTEDVVADMRVRRAKGERLKDISEFYGVHRSAALAAISGRSWKHISDPPPLKITNDMRKQYWARAGQ